MSEATRTTSVKEDITLNLKKTTKLFILQCKTIFLNPVLIFMVMFFPIIWVLGIGCLIPTRSLYTAAFSIVQILVIGIVYGNLKFSIDTTTFNSNSRLTVINEVQKVLSTIAVVFIASFISYNIEVAVMILFDSNNLIFMSGFVFQPIDDHNSMDVLWKDISWSGFYLYYVATFFLSISTYYFTSKFFSSTRTFSIFILVLMLVNIFFGGIMSSIWLYYDPKTEEFIANGKLVGDWHELSYEKAIDFTQPSFHLTDWHSYVPIVLPQWFNNQHFYYVFGAGARYTGNPTPNVANLTFEIPANFDLMYWSKIDNLWNFSIVAPYLYTIVFIMLGLIIKK